MRREDNFIDILKEVFTTNWENPALHDYTTGLSYTHAELCEKVAKLHIIFDKCGIKRGNKVGIMGRNSSHWAISYLATVTAGVVVVPILDDFNPIDIENILNHSETDMLFCDANLWKNINNKNLTTLKYAVALEDFNMLFDAPERLEDVINSLQYDFEKLYPNGVGKTDLNYVILPPDEMISLNYTSGTTSLTKGVMLSSRSIVNNITYIPFEMGGRGVKIERTICVLPMAHAYGLACAFLGTLIYGSEIYFLGKLPTPNLMTEACQKVKPELLLLVPLVFEKIYKYNVAPLFQKRFIKMIHEVSFLDKILHKVIVGKIKKGLGGNLKEVIIGGAAFNSHIEKFLVKGGFPFTVGYGMTECGPLVSYIQHELFVKKSVGRVLKGGFIDIRIAKEHNEDESGEIQVLGENVMLGYYKDEAATEATFTADGWLKTGDLGLIDEDGNLFIKGRSKTMLLGPSGENIYPEAIETKLSSLPYVGECIIMQNDKNKLDAYVYPDYARMKVDGCNDNCIKNVMEKNRLKLNRITARYENVSAIYILEQPLPKTPKNTVKRYGLEKYLKNVK